MTNKIIYGPHACQLAAKPDQATEDAIRDILSYEPRDQMAVATAKFIFVNGKRVFNKRYQEDPKKYLYHRGTRQFPTGLLPKVLALLQGATVEKVPGLPQAKPFNLPNLQPRYYQTKAHQELTTYGRGVAILPTGTGKTPVCAMLSASYPGQTILCTTPNRRLLHQNRNEMAKFLDQPVGILGDSEQELEPDVVVATIQSLVSRIERGDKSVIDWLSQVTVWICDESHGAAAESYRILSKHLANCHLRFGVTATWMREDGCELIMEGVLGDVLYTYTYDEAFSDKFLTPIRVWLKPIKYAGSRKRGQKPNFAQHYKDSITENDGRNLQIALDAAAMIDADMTPCLVMVSKIEHGKRLAELLDCPFINGQQETKKVDQVLQSFTAGEFPVLVASSILNVGVNLRELRSAINAAAGDSRINALQQPGRGLRLHETKTHFDYLDYLDEDPYYFESHSYNRRFTYKKNFPGRVKDIKLESVPIAISTTEVPNEQSKSLERANP